MLRPKKILARPLLKKSATPLPETPMRHQALIDACQLCAEICARCDLLTRSGATFNDCPACCRACKAACEMVEALAAVEGILFIQAIRLCIGITTWCAEQCSQQEDPDYHSCAEACRACRDQCQWQLEMQVSEMIQRD
jgi:hypothetical protein